MKQPVVETDVAVAIVAGFVQAASNASDRGMHGRVIGHRTGKCARWYQCKHAFLPAYDMTP